jgi:hypothetical protein
MAAAITGASIVMIKAQGASSLYHIFIARCLANVNLAGHGAALIYGSGSRVNWDLRLILMLLFMPVYLYWTWLSVGEFESWDYRTPLCFRNDNYVGGKYTTWMLVDMIWVPPGYLVILMQRFKRSEDWVARFEKAMWHWPRNIYQAVADATRAACGEGARLGIVFTNVALVFIYILAAFSYSLLLLGTFLVVTPPGMLPFSQLFFCFWAIYDEITVWNANASKVVAFPAGMPNASLQSNPNPERDWGFGQLLPLFLLLLPILQIADSFKGMSFLCASLAPEKLGAFWD